MSLLLVGLVRRTRLSWYRFTLSLCLCLILLAIATAYLDGVLAEFFGTDRWRDAFFYPLLIAYILVVIPALQQSGDDALEALRPLVDLDDSSFARLLDDTFSVSPRGELVALGVGAALGLASLSAWVLGETFSWMAVYWSVVMLLEFCLLTWCIYVAVAGTRPIAVVHRHLRDVDILDLGRFEPIGRHSLRSSLVFVGGAAIDLVVHLGDDNALEVGSLVVYGILSAVAATVFFLSMRATHGVLASAKDRELQRVQDNIIAAYRSLEAIPVGSPDIGSVSAKLDLWQAYERRLRGVRTWPYNLGMLRTLSVSVFTPVAISVAQKLLGQLLG